jgi:hypothetical protein
MAHQASPVVRLPATQGKQLKPSKVLLDSLLVGIHARNDVVHNGADAPDQDQLREILTNIGRLLWIWDFYAGHAWALETSEREFCIDLKGTFESGLV